MKCLLIGGGHRGLHGFVPAIQACGLDLVAVCDTDPSVEGPLRLALAKIGIDAGRVRLHSDLEEALAQHQPDVAIVATSPASHLEIVKTLIKAGIPIFKEKPFAVSLRDAHELAEIIEKHDAYMRLSTQRHYSPTYRHASNLLYEVGQVTSFTATDHRLADRFDLGWRAEPSMMGGNVLADFGYHMIDVLQWFFGTPQAVAVQPQKDPRVGERPELAALVKIAYPHDIVGTLSLSICDPERVEALDVCGHAGRLRVSTDSFTRFAPDGGVVDRLSREPRWPSGVLEVLKVFLQDLGRSDLSRAEAQRGVAVTAAIEAMFQSAATGRQVVVAADRIK
ncbi:Gfo/Idh/MocA family oxidoreductase [Micromonospora sp. WMMD718]|uniref:Gfo/Idh/MocA family protein n=1 Tax=unclassified Micromonospora TaxID=2617518 RepID=UPI00064B86D3|nr:MULTISPECIES: Gfo/Idh/MocA family oxidoreductase [unclassified Micromonospora]MDG4755846.1 Gfo/Idh/MocA family oxidoreductase [Micromonospora sp. WMMD718]